MSPERVRIKDISAKSILVKSNLPDTELVINPYIGCQFACAYCYASFMGRSVDEPVSQWGRYVYPKTNALEIFEKELQRLQSKGKYPTILLSSVTDPYQPLEKRYQLTRGILQRLSGCCYPGRVSILTKSSLVLRDVELFKQLPLCEVGSTVTTDDDRLGRELEAYAPTATTHLNTLKSLTAAGIETYAFLGPLLPYYVEWPKKLEHLIEKVSEAGVRSVYVEHLNPSRYISQRINQEMKKQAPSRAHALRKGEAVSARSALDQLILPLLQCYGIRLRMGQPIIHS